jgi:hypothetical protein
MILIHGRGAAPESIPAPTDKLICVENAMRRLATQHQHESTEVGIQPA